MSEIHTEDRARRLAKSILADIELYNKEKLRDGGDLADEIDEGRELFRSRAPDFASVFEAALADSPLASSGGARGAAGMVPRDHRGTPPSPTETTSATSIAIAVGIAIVIAGAGMAYYLMQVRRGG